MTTDEQLRATLAALERLADELTKIVAVFREELERDIKRKKPFR
jgi:hypothetical protein